MAQEKLSFRGIFFLTPQNPTYHFCYAEFDTSKFLFKCRKLIAKPIIGSLIHWSEILVVAS